MELRDHIEDIRANLKAGRYQNEASVSQGIVLRLLNILGWPTYDTKVVSPEYTVGGKRVDFALTAKHNKPSIFIEVKQVGQANGADRQLFEYAFHVGVPMAILTDGQEWNFYLPAEQGDYQERRVYKLDLLEREVEESVYRLNRYLNHQEVESERYHESARKDYKDKSRVQQMKSTLPVAWEKLVSEQDSLLIELLADKVEELCGYQPDIDTVSDFLTNTLKKSERQLPDKWPVSTPSYTNEPKPAASANGVGFSLHGKFYPCRKGIDVMVAVLEKLSENDQKFCERFASRKQGRTRNYLARTKEELYPGSPHLKEYSRQLKSGWWVGTNYSKNSMSIIIEMACDVAGLKFGKDLVTNL